MDLCQIISMLKNALTLDNVEKIFKIGAISVGGVWVYFNFFKGRTYRSRLIPTVSGKMVLNQSTCYLEASMELKNAGLSNVDLSQEGSYLRLSCYTVPDGISRPESAEWENIAIFPVFEDHQWIEPNETISEQKLIVMSNQLYNAFQLELQLTSKGTKWKTKNIIRVT